MPSELGLEGVWTEKIQQSNVKLRKRPSWKVCREILELCGVIDVQGHHSVTSVTSAEVCL